MKKINCPEWLKDPARYDICFDFNYVDWYDQLDTRHRIDFDIKNDSCDYSFNKILKDSPKLISAASINKFLGLSSKKPTHEFQQNEFIKHGLVYRNVWSMSVGDVKLKNEIAMAVQKDIDFVGDDYPINLCERFRPKHFHSKFSGIASLNVDLLGDENQVFDEFKAWFKGAKHFFQADNHKTKNETVTHSKIQAWAEHRVLAYFDLMLWIKKHKYSYGGKGSQIEKKDLAEWLYYDKAFIDNDKDKPRDLTRMLHKASQYYKIISNLTTYEVLGRRMFSRTIKQTPCSTTLEEFVLSKGYKNK